MEFTLKKIKTDVLVIGGGAAGLYGSIVESEKENPLKILIVDKGHVKRSGCLAAGVNALNAYLDNENEVYDYVENIKKEFKNIVREDLAISIGKGLKEVTQKVEELGLTILKDKDGNYIKRGKRSIKINGENIKEVLYRGVKTKNNIEILNNTNVIDYLEKDGEVIGAVAASIKEKSIYLIYSKAVICATGGASGIYKGNSSKQGRHKMWYSPFNTGGGLAMGIRAGAEMTSFEFRFVALRIKDTIAPTGTIAQGLKAPMINKLGEDYTKKYLSKTQEKVPGTILRLFGALEEKKKGRGPCFIETKGIDDKTEEELYKAYLNMAPIQTLYWCENNIDIKKRNVEITGTEPYIVGGHSVSGYFVDTFRRTTLKGLYAAGDVVGGVGKKYVTGAFVEGEIVFNTVRKDILDKEFVLLSFDSEKLIVDKIEKFFKNDFKYKIEEIEEEMQEVMDEYCGGISKGYGFTEEGLEIGKKKIKTLMEKGEQLSCSNFHEYLFIRELIDRLWICRVLIEHMKARKERRIRVYNENLSYPFEDKNYLKYCNSIYTDGEIKILFRELIKGGTIIEYKNK